VHGGVRFAVFQCSPQASGIKYTGFMKNKAGERRWRGPQRDVFTHRAASHPLNQLSTEPPDTYLFK